MGYLENLTFDDISIHASAPAGHPVKAENKATRRRRIEELNVLEPGTPIFVFYQGREEVLAFICIKRSRFVAERHDGRIVTVPASLFIRSALRIGVRPAGVVENQMDRYHPAAA